MTDFNCSFGETLLEAANKAVGELRALEIPADYESGDFHDAEIIAEIRHQFTNYEALLEGLPKCWEHWDQGGHCEWDPESVDLECIYEEQAHQLPKWAAKEIARTMYEEWKQTTRE